MTDPTALRSSNELAEDRTELATERTFLAYERTLMAWLRTALSMISFGFTLAKFFQYLAEQRGGALVGHFGRTWASDTVGLAMVAIGTVALVMAVIQHHRRVTALRAYGLPQQWSLALWVAGVVAALGVFAFLSLVFQG
jgi:putative membrane protein